MDMLIRDNLGNRIHAGRVIREFTESFIKDEIQFPFKTYDYSNYCYLTINGENLETKVYQDVKVTVGAKYDLKTVFKNSGIGLSFVEYAFYSNNSEISGSRVRKEVTAKEEETILEVKNITPPATSDKIRIMVGIKSLGELVEMYLNSVSFVILPHKEELILDGSFKKWSNDTFVNWSRVVGSGGSATGVFNCLPSNFETGNACEIYGRKNIIKSGVSFYKPFVMDNFRELNLIVEGFNFPDDIAKITMGITNENLTCGVALIQEKIENTCKIVVYKEDGTFTETPVAYQLIGGINGDEIKHRRNLSITVFPKSKYIYVLEGDQVIYKGVHNDLVTTNSCTAKFYTDYNGAGNYRIRISQIKMQLIHN